MPRTRPFGGSLESVILLPCLCVGVSSFLPSSSTNYNLILILLLAGVGVSHCHGTCHSFDVPKQSCIHSMFNVSFILTISYFSLSLQAQ